MQELNYKNIGINQIDKHSQYQDKYPTNTIFWGLGIENEFYLEFDKKIQIDKNFFLNNHKRERYSVDYYTNYKPNLLANGYDHVANKLVKNPEDSIDCVILLNSHSFTKTDTNNNSKTTYTKNPQPNPKFSGKTLIEILIESDKYFSNTQDTYWTFDGDTIEIVNLNFSNIKLSQMIGELNSNKKEFELKLQEIFSKLEIFKNYGTIQIMKQNYPWAIYMTNPNNVGMFNNGTLHYNITLPTLLNDKSHIFDKNKFIRDHKKAIKIIQWFEPIILAMFGSPDPFAYLIDFQDSDKFSKSSQRGAVSRYIGIGTYDTDKMIPGKILQINLDEFEYSKDPEWWYNKYHNSSAYNKLNQIGLDINFNKHFSHGIEIRFLDHLDNSKSIEESFEFIIWLIDWALDPENTFDIPNPIKNVDWNNLVYGCFKQGKEYKLNLEQISLYSKLFKLAINENTSIKNFYTLLKNYLIIKYSKVFVEKDKTNSYKFILGPCGEFSKYCLEKKEINKEIDKELYNYYFLELDKQLEKINKDNIKNNDKKESYKEVNKVDSNKLDNFDQIDIDIESSSCCIPWFKKNKK